MAFAAAAVVCAGLFAGAALYINLVEHPARMECGIALAHTEFGPSYRRASVMQASLAVLGGLAGVAAWLTGLGVGWLIGAGLIASVIPFTLLVILPTNRALLATRPGEDTDRVARLLAQWARLHAVRTGASLLAFLLFVGLLATRRPG